MVAAVPQIQSALNFFRLAIFLLVSVVPKIFELCYISQIIYNFSLVCVFFLCSLPETWNYIYYDYGYRTTNEASVFFFIVRTFQPNILASVADTQTQRIRIFATGVVAVSGVSPVMIYAGSRTGKGFYQIIFVVPCHQCTTFSTAVRGCASGFMGLRCTTFRYTTFRRTTFRSTTFRCTTFRVQ